MNIQQEDQAYFDSREKKAQIIIEELAEEGYDPNKKYTVLEVGCNHGFITYHIAQKTNWSMKGGDVDDNVHKYKKEFKKHIDIDYLDATKMPYKKGVFDIVILNHVIEHIPHWEEAIHEIYRVLKKGGVLYLATPNKYRKIPHPKDRWAVTKRVLFHNRDNPSREDRMEYHMGFSAVELEELLEPFSEIKCLNKPHFVRNSPALIKHILKALPHEFHKKRAQTCLFIAKK